MSDKRYEFQSSVPRCPETRDLFDEASKEKPRRYRVVWARGAVARDDIPEDDVLACVVTIEELATRLADAVREAGAVTIYKVSRLQ
jgi:hypothetical protein